MTRNEYLISEITKERNIAIENFYEQTRNTYCDDLSEEERTHALMLSNIEYGRAGAFDEVLRLIKKDLPDV